MDELLKLTKLQENNDNIEAFPREQWKPMVWIELCGQQFWLPAHGKDYAVMSN